MGKPKIKNSGDGVLFCGMASQEVTGSCYYVKFGDKKILLECGMHQDNNFLNAYRVNSKNFDFKPQEIDYVFIAHMHLDHFGLVCKLVKDGFKGKIIVNSKCADLIKPMLLNCVYICGEEARLLSKKFKREYTPIYDEKDVYKTLDFIYEYDYMNTLYELDENVSFKWYKNSHTVGAVQLSLILKNENKCKKILYTSDVGSLQPKNHYVEPTEIVEEFHDVVLLESTYGNGERQSKRSREKDLEIMKCAIETSIEKGGTVIIPAFSFLRSQEIMTNLYELFHKDKSFKVPIVVDSMLTADICKLYESCVDNNDKLWKKVMKWDNMNLSKESTESKSWLAKRTPKIVISSSGFCTSGRILNWLENYINDENTTIIFTGYAGGDPSYLSYRIKNNKEFPIININKKPIPNKAKVVVLTSFSSHADLNDLIEIGSSVNTNKLVLVHGDGDAKLNLQKELKKAISKKDKSFKVLVSHKGMIARL